MLPEVTNIEPELFLSWGKVGKSGQYTQSPARKATGCWPSRVSVRVAGPAGRVNAACVCGHFRALLDAIDRRSDDLKDD
jgi:hypothetical protein